MRSTIEGTPSSERRKLSTPLAAVSAEIGVMSQIAANSATSGT